MLIQASQSGWKEITSDESYFGEQPCASHTSYSSSTRFTNTARHWPTLSSVGLRSTVVKKPRKMTISELVKIVEHYECALNSTNGKLIMHGEPEDLVRALSRLATTY